MVALLLFSLCVGLSTAFRGPHHPRSVASHHHYSPQQDVKLTQDADLLHDATHLKEDLGPMAETLDFSKMSEEETEFHFFKAHDVDNNAKLDGLEILYAIQHTNHDNGGGDTERNNFSGETIESERDMYLPMIVGLVDKVLEEDDLDNDGYLGYIEFALGRKKDHATQAERTGRQKRPSIGK